MRSETKIIASMLICFMVTACDFNINDNPGPQMSISVNESIKHGTFICAYKLKKSEINGTSIEAVFAERKFYRKKGLLLTKVTSCCNSHLIVVSKNKPFSTQNSGYGIDWMLTGFTIPSPEASVIYCDYRGTLYPDSMSISVISLKIKDKGKVVEKLTIYKEKQLQTPM